MDKGNGCPGPTRGISTDLNSPKCNEALHTPEHSLNCPSILKTWLEIFGTTKPLLLPTLSIFPGKFVTLVILCEHLVYAISISQY